MDQMTSVFGEQDRLFAMECQPANIRPSLAVPNEISFWGIDSGIRHSVSGGDYGSVRTGAFMGYRIIASIAGLKVTYPDLNQVVQIEDSKWKGYLCNISPYEFERNYSPLLPEQIIGREFLSNYRGTTDYVTSIDAERSYAVRTPTAHPIYENVRVREYAEALVGELDEPALGRLGEMMYQSHDSYSACGLGSWGTDLIVNMVKSAGPERGLFGAKITGGGSGGTVAIMGLSTAGDVINDIVSRYAKETGYRPYVFHGSSSGAARFGHLKLVGRRQ
jgi:L-arabinokinase